MGALHKGHIKLIKLSQKKCVNTIVSIFVNPNQFNNKNDYKRYPRNISKDLSKFKDISRTACNVSTSSILFEINKRNLNYKINVVYQQPFPSISDVINAEER